MHRPPWASRNIAAPLRPPVIRTGQGVPNDSLPVVPGDSIRNPPTVPSTARLASPMRLRSALLLLVATPLAAQSRRQLTSDDYARAEQFLGASTAPLVIGAGVRPTWTEDGRFWYRATVPGGSAFYVVDPVRRSRQALFDQ